ncbi:MAG: DNA polymerase III, epsilon subunit [uncultured bacterium]|nr:MAG: DNA polymerase III, epsilon subunit [uncultured bacterium]OFW67963.1 MAG: DNA polymerase III subunit epsilon [Alphaproteobacteria bacterium GWC2_42_16]OFW74693.1 MAG: DNA polymerase III subunit epsilon [Alphaproteobacteria bacterium GWA2_41_27]OFW84970.1 MAG: DNA polymerase III subunit epsilon [Alphaproteobacteria bacterium RIFCSPHIGHO2_12_FULL_42_100]OFW85563.1 MAG: DNA polymerase III subunit epsilon [Alphaproteobacteria bacterium RBG_16_42_14]OFW92111.1 MAG: DNA polymerase III subuni
MAREIVLDTETTGFEPSQGHRLVEIGCIELINYLPSGRVFHTYINPERDVPDDAYNVHGLSYEFLKNHPLFRDVGSSFLNFIEDSPLVIHNAKFDMKFLNAELQNHNLAEIPFGRAIDTLMMARKKFPGSPASLDALCKRFGVDNKGREKHGALLDAELLAQVYLELIGGKQPSLSLHMSSKEKDTSLYLENERTFHPPRSYAPTPEERALHQELIAKLNQSLWPTASHSMDEI